ncbi:MAG: prepilin-type N-terminal cleavage/methylation domain-containing protein [Planctomycetes bacterium]|nr:prepilin-type N-terminal cleavage/methylation domain-containing protein [Planctomycetota bacterium]
MTRLSRTAKIMLVSRAGGQYNNAGSELVIRRRSAFTLIELIVVMGILALLIGILVPSLQSARNSAKANVCLSTLKGLGTAFTVYLTENRDHFPPARLKHVPPSNTEVEYVNEYLRKSPRWQWFLEMGAGPVIDPAPNIRGTELRPWGDAGVGSRGSRLGTTMTIAGFSCPALVDDEFAMDIRSGAYGYNYQYLGNGRQDTDPTRWDNFSVGLHQIKAPGGTVLIADSRGAGKVHGIHSYALDPPRLAVERDAVRFGPDESDVPEALDAARYAFSPVEMRHNRRGNVIFVDAHGEAMTQRELGYQFDDDGPPVPIFDPSTAAPGVEVFNGQGYNNAKWTGRGRDRFAVKRDTDSAP